MRHGNYRGNVMTTQKIDLYEYFKLNRNGANGGYLTVYARAESVEIKRRSRPAMLVLPGGAYAMLSDIRRKV